MPSTCLQRVQLAISKKNVLFGSKWGSNIYRGWGSNSIAYSLYKLVISSRAWANCPPLPLWIRAWLIDHKIVHVLIMSYVKSVLLWFSECKNNVFDRQYAHIFDRKRLCYKLEMCQYDTAQRPLWKKNRIGRSRRTSVWIRVIGILYAPSCPPVSHVHDSYKIPPLIGWN